MRFTSTSLLVLGLAFFSISLIGCGGGAIEDFEAPASETDDSGDDGTSE